MPFPVYSKLLGGANSVDSNGIPEVIGIVPQGFVWVVRHVSAINVNLPPYGLVGLTIQDQHEYPIYAVGRDEAIAGKWYGATVHQTLEYGDSIYAVTVDQSWNLRVSGFELQAV